jgi:hypothetical protein
MKPLIFLAALFLLSCTKQNQGLHASLSITQSSGEWILSAAGSSGPISTWEIRVYPMPATYEAQTYGPSQLWGPNTWEAPGNASGISNSFGTNAYIYDKATLIVKDNAGHEDSTVVNQQF